MDQSCLGVTTVWDTYRSCVHEMCGVLEMVPHVNKWSPLDGAQE